MHCRSGLSQKDTEGERAFHVEVCSASLNWTRQALWTLWTPLDLVDALMLLCLERESGAGTSCCGYYFDSAENSFAASSNMVTRERNHRQQGAIRRRRCKQGRQLAYHVSDTGETGR